MESNYVLLEKDEMEIDSVKFFCQNLWNSISKQVTQKFGSSPGKKSISEIKQPILMSMRSEFDVVLEYFLYQGQLSDRFSQF